MSFALSLNPSRCAKFWHQKQRDKNDSTPLPRVQVANNSKADPGMSKKARKRLKNSISWLCYLSTSRRVQVGKQKFIPKFQISFITLTLPSIQQHTHAELKRECLNHFLVIARKKWRVENYVWKLELQKNGNAHFHLTLDRPVPWQEIRRQWNGCLSKLGYISAYQDRFKTMSFSDYTRIRNSSGEFDKRKIRKSFDYGVYTDWQDPNTTDVKSVKDVRNLASYLSKYLSKPPTDSHSTKAQLESAKGLTGRLWYCSQSLSSLGNCLVPFSLHCQAFLRELNSLAGVFRISGDYWECWFYKLGSLPLHLRTFLRESLLSHAYTAGYPFPAAFPSA